MNTSCLVATNKLSVSFAGQVILTDVSIQVYENKVVTLIGPNGAGKSTLIQAILGLVKPITGSVYVKPSIRIGYMPQKLAIEALMPITVKRFLELTNYRHTVNYKAILIELGIGGLLASPLQKISAGELQRVLLARALLLEPDLLILDEPAQGVDIVGQSELYQLIVKIRDKNNCGILMVSHDLHLVMAETDIVVCLNKHICCAGCPKLVSTDPGFISIFGQQAADRLAFYAHDHNHHHDLSGEIVQEKVV